MTTANPQKPKWYHLRKKFLLLLLSFLALLVGIAWWFHLPMGSGPAGPAIPEAPFRQVWSTQPVLVVGMGDSITTGFGAGGKRYGYFNMLITSPPDDIADMRGKDLSRVFPGIRVMNIADNASSSGYHLRSQLPRIPPQPKEVLGLVFLTTGGIDLIHNYGKTAPKDEAIYGATYAQGVAYAKKFRQRLELLLDGIRAKFAGKCHIFLANIYDPTDGVGDVESVHPLLRLVQKLPPWPDGLKLLALWNRHLREAAQARDYVHFVDIHTVMLGHGIHCRDKSNPHYHSQDPHYWYFFNLEDPNRRGYDAIRRMFLQKVTAVFYRQPDVTRPK